jgi:hypothetical protein
MVILILHLAIGIEVTSLKSPRMMMQPQGFAETMVYSLLTTLQSVALELREQVRMRSELPI